MATLTIIHTEDALYLTTRAYAGWRAVQDDFLAYKTSLGGFSEAALIEYLAQEYPNGPRGGDWGALVRELAHSLRMDTVRVLP
ncbi:hypothetical protein BCF33_2354 [Hasllibacter halocynthiae]|uniref:Uncharacterized protein n=1 Tax=Hasllibacter halocynthiae TaxID=595589 RepID=A0A2T0X3K7_9RHOB|nr:hypothetical protein [Hasllibacter halocynthiae]PRY93485.1 hypothetical protein BCF33_2354 [Hasllibacter halocynthiae]